MKDSTSILIVLLFSSETWNNPLMVIHIEALYTSSEVSAGSEGDGSLCLDGGDCLVWSEAFKNN